MRWPVVKSGGLGLAAMAYVVIDYLRIISPTWHERLQPLLWSLLALVAVTRVPFYRHWSVEFRAAIPFLASMMLMLSALLFEALNVRFVTAVLGLDWHNARPPLPDSGQWLLLALNEKLPEAVVEILRAHIIGLHHYLMLFIMLAFSVLFDSVKAPALGLGARYMFTMAVGRLLRAVTFASTILPSARPWCASSRYSIIPRHPHRWAQKYYAPYASDTDAIRQVIQRDMAYADSGNYSVEYHPDWGSMSFLIDILRPTTSEGSSWYSLLKKAGGGCNDLVYSGHMRLTGGYSSALLWLLVIHSVQREIRERHHYSVDCVVAVYAGILLWKMTGFIWSVRDGRLAKLGKIQGKLVQAAKDCDMDQVRELLKDVELRNEEGPRKGGSKVMWLFASGTMFFSLTIVILAFTFTTDG
ncbi:hypothetical protein GQ457_12G013090 [Hibiscus cannabinus]